MSWDPPPADTEDTATKVHLNMGAKSDVTMSYCSVCKLWDYHNSPGHGAWQDTPGGASGTGVHAATNVGGGEDLYDDFITCIG